LHKRTKHNRISKKQQQKIAENNNIHYQSKYTINKNQYKYPFNSIKFLSMMEFQLNSLKNVENDIDLELKDLLDKIFGELYQMFKTLTMNQKGFLY